MSLGKYSMEEFGLDPGTFGVRMQGIHKQFNGVKCCNTSDCGNVKASEDCVISHADHKSAMDQMRNASDGIASEAAADTTIGNEYDDIESSMDLECSDDYDEGIDEGEDEGIDEGEDIEACGDVECGYKRGKETKFLRKKAAKGIRSRMTPVEKKKMRKSLMKSMKKHGINASMDLECSEDDIEDSTDLECSRSADQWREGTSGPSSPNHANYLWNTVAKKYGITYGEDPKSDKEVRLFQSMSDEFEADPEEAISYLQEYSFSNPKLEKARKQMIKESESAQYREEE